MKKYVRIIQRYIKAMPMTRVNDLRLRGKDVNYIERDEDGYLLEWEDGTTTWMPKGHFEKTFRPYESEKDRLSAEREDIAERLERLNKMLEDEGTDEIQRSLMNQQKQAMLCYIRTLNARVAMS